MGYDLWVILSAVLNLSFYILHSSFYIHHSIMPEKDEFRHLNETMRQSVNYSQMGLQIALSFIVFAVLGYWLDKYLQKYPLFTLLGVVFGLLAMGYQLRSLLLKLKAADNNRHKRVYNPNAFKDLDEAEKEIEKAKWGNE